MKKWCEILEYNDRQYLFTNHYATDDEPATMKLSTCFNNFLVEYKVAGKDDIEEFSQENFGKFINIERVKEFEKMILDMMENKE